MLLEASLRTRTRRAALGGLLACLAAAATTTTRPASAQSRQWSATLTVRPFPSPLLADWQRHPPQAELTVFSSGLSAQEYRVEGVVRKAGAGEIARGLSPVRSAPFGPFAHRLTAPEVTEWRATAYDRAYSDIVRRTGLIPEGSYELCARVLDLQGRLLAEACEDFASVLPEPPELLAPHNRERVTTVRPVFQWTTVTVPPQVGLIYRLRIARRLPLQTPQVALQVNIPHHEAEVTGPPAYVYPVNALPLVEGEEYAWQVEALDAEGNPVTAGGRKSEIWTFVYGAVKGVVADGPTDPPCSGDPGRLSARHHGAP